MTRKSKRKKKQHKQREVPIVPLPQPPPPTQTVSRKQIRFLEGLGIVLTAIGLIALIELFPRLSSSATPPLDLGNQLASSRFTVTNDGYLQVTDVMSACFLWNVVEGGFHAHGSMARVAVPPENRLRPTESYTVPCTSENMITTTPPFILNLKSADL